MFRPANRIFRQFSQSTSNTATLKLIVGEAISTYHDDIRLGADVRSCHTYLRETKDFFSIGSSSMVYYPKEGIPASKRFAKLLSKS